MQAWAYAAVLCAVRRKQLRDVTVFAVNPTFIIQLLFVVLS
jgi:hypothetical protein